MAAAAFKETLAEAANRIRKEFGQRCCVCVLGGTAFHGKDSEALVHAIASALCDALGPQAAFVTGGMAGVQEAFAKHCGDGSCVWNLLPEGQASGYGVGCDIHAGKDLEERKAIFGQLGDVYITVEGGPGVSQEASAAYARGATIVPLRRTGGASAGAMGFPAAALERPACATEAQWALLGASDALVADTAAAVAAIVQQAAARRNRSVWELIDECIGMDRSTLTKVLGVVLLTLFLISGSLIYREVSRGRPELALVHGGFMALLVGLVASIAWVLAENARLETDKASGQVAGSKKDE